MEAGPVLVGGRDRDRSVQQGLQGPPGTLRATTKQVTDVLELGAGVTL